LSSLLIYGINSSYIEELNGSYSAVIENSNPTSTDISVVELALAKWSYDGDPDEMENTQTRF
jgi:hypothetical protein